MYLQGDLQIVFDALYHMGVIDPVLKMDWSQAFEEMNEHRDIIKEVLGTANSYQTDLDKLMEKLKNFDVQALNYLAMEVAREFADFHSRESLH